MHTRRLMAAALAALLAGPMGALTVAAAQEPDAGSAPTVESRSARARGRLAGRAAGADVMTVQQVEEYFDQVMLHQARTNLSLGPDQFLRFGAGLRRLQTVRRQQQRRRVAMVRDLNALVNRTPFDDAAVSAKLKELDDAGVRSVDETRAAYDAIDRVLDVRQRARFRVFEEMMERRKLDLVARARRQVGTP